MNTCSFFSPYTTIEDIMTRQHDQLSMETQYRHIIDTFHLHHLDSVVELAVTPRVERDPES